MGSNGEYGCCDVGRTCSGEGGSVWIDEKVNFQSGADGGSGSGGDGTGEGEGEGGASPFGQESGAGRRAGDGVCVSILMTGAMVVGLGILGL